MAIVNNFIENMKKFFNFTIVVLFFILLGFFVNEKNIFQKESLGFNKISISGPGRYIFFGNIKVKVEIVDTVESRALGLSGRAELKDGNGMLFVFDDVGKYNFWMKNMNFPIDIIWLGEDERVIYIKENALPESYPSTFGGDEYSKYVLEVPSFFAQKNNIKIGDKIEFLK